MSRIALICPGRGTYTKTELGSLTKKVVADSSGKLADLLRRADLAREAAGRRSVTALDQAERFSAQHLSGENAAALIYVGTALDAAKLSPADEVVCVLGNSMGFYSALYVSGTLDFDAGFRVADAMGSFQKDGVIGGQVIVPVVNAEWRRDAAAASAVESALSRTREAGCFADASIHLGGYEVLAADDLGVKYLLATLPKSKVSEKDYPFQLLGHSAFHSALLAGTSEKAKAYFSDLRFSPPRVPLIDGRGHVFRPKTTRASDLFDYTFGRQVVSTYDFSTSIRVALREYGPDRLVLLGPGDSLGGAIGHVLVQERWNGIDSKTAFKERQLSDAPILEALARERTTS